MTIRQAPRRTRGTKAPALTAHVGYRPPGKDLWGHRVKEVYHAVADQDTPIRRGWAPSVITRLAGDALCGRLGPWQTSPEGLFAPLVTCPKCRDTADREPITVTGLPDTIPAGRP